MKLDVKHETFTEGLLRKREVYKVIVTGTFTEEETHIINANGASRFIMVENTIPHHRVGKNDSIQYNLYVHELLNKSTEMTFLTPGEARQFEEAVVDSAKQLKQFIDENKDGLESGSYEF